MGRRTHGRKKGCLLNAHIGAEPDRILQSRKRPRIGSFQTFRRWCAAYGFESLPADRAVVVRFLAAIADVEGCDRALAISLAIRRAHLIIGAQDPIEGEADLLGGKIVGREMPAIDSRNARVHRG